LSFDVRTKELIKWMDEEARKGILDERMIFGIWNNLYPELEKIEESMLSLEAKLDVVMDDYNKGEAKIAELKEVIEYNLKAVGGLHAEHLLEKAKLEAQIQENLRSSSKIYAKHWDIRLSVAEELEKGGHRAPIKGKELISLIEKLRGKEDPDEKKGAEEWLNG